MRDNKRGTIEDPAVDALLFAAAEPTREAFEVVGAAVYDRETDSIEEIPVPSGYLSFNRETRSILIGALIGSAETEDGRLSVIGSGDRVRFTLDGHEGFVDLSLGSFAQEALQYLRAE